MPGNARILEHFTFHTLTNSYFCFTFNLYFWYLKTSLLLLLAMLSMHLGSPTYAICCCSLFFLTSLNIYLGSFLSLWRILFSKGLLVENSLSFGLSKYFFILPWFTFGYLFHGIDFLFGRSFISGLLFCCLLTSIFSFDKLVINVCVVLWRWCVAIFLVALRCSVCLVLRNLNMHIYNF